MAITSHEAIKFSNEQIRPVAESMRSLYWKAKAILSSWYSGKNALCVNSADEVLIDGRGTDGVSALTGADINGVVVQLSAFVAMCEQSGVMDVINKPCVRTLSID